jgi:hypothetical protein
MIGAIAGLVALYAFGLPAVLRAGLGLGDAARVALAILLVVPLGLALGVPFPAALARLAARGGSAATGLAWAANGVGSVLGPVLAALLALDVGLSGVMLLAGTGYLAAGLLIARWWRGRDAGPG